MSDESMATGIAVGMAINANNECVIVDGHRYCRTSNLSVSDLGLIILVIAGIAGYVLYAGVIAEWVIDNGLPRIIGVALVGLPLVATGLWLFLQG